MRRKGTDRSVTDEGDGESKVRSRGGSQTLEEDVDQDVGVEQVRVKLVPVKHPIQTSQTISKIHKDS